MPGVREAGMLPGVDRRGDLRVVLTVRPDPALRRAGGRGGLAVLRWTGRLERADLSLAERSLRRVAADPVEAVLCDVAGLAHADPDALRQLRVPPVTLTWPAPPVWIVGASGQVADSLHGLAAGIGVASEPAEALLQVDAAPVWPRAACLLPADSTAPAQARAAIRHACAAWDLPLVQDTLAVVASELVTNAVQHAGGAGSQMRVECRAGDVLVAVHDHGGHFAIPRRPSLPQAAGLREGGRGLYVVRALVTGAGVAAHPRGGKVTWATVEIPSPVAGARRDGVSTRIAATRARNPRHQRWQVEVRLDWTPDQPDIVAVRVASTPPHPALPEGCWELPPGVLLRGLHQRVRHEALHLHPEPGGRSVVLEVVTGHRAWAVRVSSARLRRFLAGVAGQAPRPARRSHGG